MLRGLVFLIYAVLDRRARICVHGQGSSSTTGRSVKRCNAHLQVVTPQELQLQLLLPV